MKKRSWNRLSVKLILLISFTLLVNLTVYTLYTITNLKSQLTTASSQSAYNISDVIKRSTRYSMLLNRSEDIYQIINTIGTEAGVVRIRIYNKQGEISYSTKPEEINTIVNLDDEACFVCHSKPELPVNLPKNEMIREYINKDGTKVLALINPIRNEKDCSGEPCHAHSEDINILGVLDVQMSTTATDNIIKANTYDIVTNAVILTILLSVIITVFITIIVNKPLKEISKGMEQLSKGELDYRITLNRNDELGIVANEFNNMSEKLNSAYNEIKDWSETLNQRVEEKNTELKQIYNQITQIEKLASLGKLSATVAHELNNPLEGILTYSKLISKKLKKKEMNGEYEGIIKYLDLISNETSRCGRIVKDLLLFSKKGDGEFKTCSMTEIIENALVIINHHLDLNHITVIRKFMMDEPELVCDPGKIQQAIIAVLMNSIEAMPDGGKILIDLQRDEISCILRISDEGRGIHEKDLPHIFEPFYSTKGEGKGTGLGLSVTYGIIKQHDGEIEVEETSLSGTTFRIVLPVNKKFR